MELPKGVIAKYVSNPHQRKKEAIILLHPEAYQKVEKMISDGSQGQLFSSATPEIKKYPEICQFIYDECAKHFDDHLLPKDKNTWLATIDGLTRIDNIDSDTIIKIVAWARKDKFWSKNFLSLTKLRKKKDGIPYITIYHEQMKQRPGNTVVMDDGSAIGYLND